MSLLSTVASSAWLASSFPAWLRFRHALDRPREVQRTILRRLLRENAGCAYGRAFGFGGIGNYEDFQRRIPMVGYDDLSPWVRRVRDGESSVLTAEPVGHLVPTSGSTGGRKLIPFTAGLQREFNSAIGPWLIDLFRQFPSLARGTSYWSISPALSLFVGEKSAVPIGFENDSGYIGGLCQALVEATFAAPSALRLAPDVNSFRYLTLLSLLRRSDLTLISVWHPSFLTLLFDAMPGRWSELLDDVKSGGCRCAENCPAEIRRALTGRPLPDRARKLAACDPQRPETLWPRLRIVSCWGDGQASTAVAELKNRLPSTAIQAKGLLATEAFVSIPFQGLHPVAITSHFYEFRDEEDRIHLADELREGETYSVLVTTGGGLWRYRLGDLVKVDGFAGRTPSLRFLGRKGNISDLRGEKLSEAFVSEAIARAFAGSPPRFAMLAPEQDEKGEWGYTLFLEGSPQFAADMERELCENPHYAICRNLGQLRAVGCFVIRQRGYETYAATRMAQGQTLGDIKPRSLSTEADWRKVFLSRCED